MLIKRCTRLGFCLLVVMAGGCQNFGYSLNEYEWAQHLFWKKPKETGPKIATPKDRIDKLRAMAKNAPERSPAEQETESQDMAGVLRKEEDPLMRAEILRALGPYQTEIATKMLHAGLKDSDRDVRIAACEGWERHKGPEAAKVLSEILSTDADIDVRLAAARGLGTLGDPVGQNALGVALDNPDPAMQYRATESLRQITGKKYESVADWRAFVKGTNPPEPSLATRIKNWF
jgi:HEAT repeat protein